MDNSGNVLVANQSNITGVEPISSGTWQATDIDVEHGGTGVSTLTADGVLIGNGTSAVTAVDMSTNGHILIGDGDGNPQALAVDQDDYVLTADSSRATGVKWAPASSVGALNDLTDVTYSGSSGESRNLTIDDLSTLTTSASVHDAAGNSVAISAGSQQLEPLIILMAVI